MTISLKPEVLGGLAICYKVARILKEQYPNEIMKIQNDTILPHQAKNRKCHGKNMSTDGWYFQKRVTVKQRVLIVKETWRTKYKNQADRRKLYGNFALVELMCHELAHHRTSGHAKGWRIKYNRFLDFMVNLIISGKYYVL